MLSLSKQRTTFHRVILPRVAASATVSTTVRTFATLLRPYGEVSTHPKAHTIPPNHPATIGHLTTFTLPNEVTGGEADRALGLEMVNSWRQDGIFQIRLTIPQDVVLKKAFKVSKGFFSRPHEFKAKLVDDQSFSGYIASGEELTDGVPDYSEIFTVTKDLPLSDPRVQQKWPCHGPCPWPDKLYAATMTKLMSLFGESGEKLLKLTALGLNLTNPNALTELTEDGWHHMRVLRFPQVNKTNGKGKAGRGIGSHTDYGLLVLAGQDDVGGLFVRPPLDGECQRNWEKSAAGAHEHDEKWTYVPPAEAVLTVFPGKQKYIYSLIYDFILIIPSPGDMMQYMTNDFLKSTPHKVGLNTRERFAFAYFHEPNFTAIAKPLPEYGGTGKGIHYGTHFTNMFMRNYPDRVTAKRLLAENRSALLDTPMLRRESLQSSNNTEAAAL
jgi:isopenicillin N synthase-like dioxygenase